MKQNLNNSIFCLFKMKYGLDKVRDFAEMNAQYHKLSADPDDETDNAHYEAYYWEQKLKELKDI